MVKFLPALVVLLASVFLRAAEQYAPSLEAELVALNGHLVETRSFCPGEPVSLRYTAMNAGTSVEKFIRCPYPHHIRIENDKSVVVWDSEQARLRWEKELISKQGVGEMTPPSCTVWEIPPGQIVEWRGEWDQRDIEAKQVLPGRHEIGVRYGLFSDPGSGASVDGPIAETVIEISNSNSSC